MPTLKHAINVAYMMIIFSSFALSTTAAEIVVYLVLTAVIAFAGNRVMKLIDKIDSVHDFVTRQESTNHKTTGDLNELRNDLTKLENDLKGQVGRIESKLDNFIIEIRKDRA